MKQTQAHFVGDNRGKCIDCGISLRDNHVICLSCLQVRLAKSLVLEFFLVPTESGHTMLVRKPTVNAIWN